MERGAIKEFIHDTLEQHNIKDEGEWVMTNCPLASWTHTGGTDNSMSFGIKANEIDHSVFHCFTCKEKGTLKMLLENLQEFTGENYGEDIDGIEDDEDLNATLPAWGNRKTYDTKFKKLGDPVSEDYLDLYDSAVGHPYMEERGIEDWAIEEMGLCVDPDNREIERILFPVFSHTGGFYGYSGRATTECDTKVRDYFGLQKRSLLLGSHLVDQNFIVLVEGLFDYANLYQFEAPVVAVMHSGITPEQAAILKTLGKKVYVMFDDDKAGRLGRKQVREELESHLPLLKTRYPKDKTVWDEREGYPRAPADPGELDKLQYLRMISDARLL